MEGSHGQSQATRAPAGSHGLLSRKGLIDASKKYNKQVSVGLSTCQLGRSVENMK